MRVAVSITLTDDEQATLQRWARGRSVEARRVLRAKIVLAAATGQQNQEIADDLGTLRKTVALWRNRFAQRRLAGIEKDAPRGGRPAMTKQKLAAQIVKTTITQQPPTRHALEHADAGRALGHVAVDGAAGVEGDQPPASLRQ